MLSKVSCLRKQHNGRDWALNHQPSGLNSLLYRHLFPLPVQAPHTELPAEEAKCTTTINYY